MHRSRSRSLRARRRILHVAGVDLADWLVSSGLALDWPRYSHGDYAVAQNEVEHSGKGMCGWIVR